MSNSANIPSPNDLLASLAQYPQVKRWWVALSGGLDSTVLLHLAAQAYITQSQPLQAVHINHQLQPEAEQWTQQCQHLCDQLSVSLHTVKVDVSAGSGPEDSARQARYQAFESLLQAGDGLLLAHHGDDQAETLLLRLLRGSGVTGLAAIPTNRSLGKGLLVRPLLTFTRAQLQRYAEEHNLRWIEDGSNQDNRYDRNFLRNQILPSLKQRWPKATESLSRSAAYCSEADDLLKQLAEIDYAGCQISSMAGEGLKIADLLALPANRQTNLLRYWLGLFMPQLPGAIFLQRILKEVAASRDDADPEVTLGSNKAETYQVRRHQDALYLINPADWQPPPAFEWDGKTSVTLPAGVLSVEPAAVGEACVQLPGNLSIRFRQGGERINLAAPKPDGASSQLKKWLQNTSMPSWQRECLPLVYAGDELIAVPDFGRGMLLAEGASANTGGLLLRWHHSAFKGSFSA